MHDQVADRYETLFSFHCDVFVTAFPSIPSLDGASKARLYPESDHEDTYLKNFPCSAAHENTQTQSNLARFSPLISCAIQCANHMHVLQCVTAIVIK